MKSRTIIYGAGLLICILISASFSYAASKVGVFDFKEVLTQSKAGAAAFEKLQEEGNTRKKQLDSKISEFKRLQQESMIVSGNKHKDVISKLKDLKQDIEGDQKTYAREMQEMELKMLKPVRARIVELVKDVGKKNNFTLILEVRESGTLYFDEAIDLTKTIIERYDAQYAQ